MGIKMAWIRQVQIIVTSKNDPSKVTIFANHRIDFEVRSTIGWPADTANITLYNLSIAEVKSLQNKNYGEMYIEIRAGYADSQYAAGTNLYGKPITYDSGGNVELAISSGLSKNLVTVFSGVITNAIGYRRRPEHITQLFCISKAYGAATDFKQMRAIPPGMKLIDVIEQMSADYGFNVISYYGFTDDIKSLVLPRGRTFQDVFLVEFRKLLGEYNMQFQITTGEVAIFSDTFGDRDAVSRMAKDRGLIQIDANMVIGNPVAGICTYRLDLLLQPSYQPGMVIDVSPLLGEEILVNGVTSITGTPVILNTDQSVFRWAMENRYVIMETLHHGSTHAMDFKTSISAVIGGNTAMGYKEQVWQDMYAQSGMAME